MWDIATGELLTTFLFPKPVSTVIVDPSETKLFAACENVIYPVELYRRRFDQAYGGDIIESTGGMAKVETIGIRQVDPTSKEDQDDIPTAPMFSGHT